MSGNDDLMKRAEELRKLTNAALLDEFAKLKAELATERERHARVIDDYQRQMRILAKEREEVEAQRERATMAHQRALRAERACIDVASRVAQWMPGCTDSEAKQRVIRAAIFGEAPSTRHEIVDPGASQEVGGERVLPEARNR